MQHVYDMSIHMLDKTENIETTSSVKLFRDWVAEGRITKAPAELAGCLWRAGEVGLLVGETGSGKSLLAVEIADRISRHYPSELLDCNAGEMDVLYVDLEMNARQLVQRYSYEPIPGEPPEDYEFSSRLHRLQIDPLEFITRYTPQEAAKAFVTKLAAVASETNAQVIVIDSITALKRSYYGASELMPVIRRLRHLAELRGLSILMTATIAKRDHAQPLTLADLGGLRLAARCVETVFAIGRGGKYTNVRYVKHLSSRNSQVIYDKNGVLSFKIGMSGNFLGLEFAECYFEKAYVNKRSDQEPDSDLDTIRKLHAQGHSVREIADMVGRSKSTIQRLLKRYGPENAEIIDDDPVEEPIEPEANKQQRQIPYEFPGVEENEAALSDPKFADLGGRQNTEKRRLRREHSLIEAAATRANKIFLETGKAPHLAEDPGLSKFYADRFAEEKVDSS